MTHHNRLARLGAIACFLIAAAGQNAWAQGLKALEFFIKNTRSGQASFTQTVTPPSKDGQAVRARQSSGSFAFSRPGLFRFDYAKPFEQSIVADGGTLWLYDADLNQVTARRQAETLANTPAGILVASGDLKALERDFTLKDAPDADGLQWALAEPRSKEGQLQNIRIGFKGDQLAVLDILDGFGQRTVMRFGALELNPNLPASRFAFTPPKGADVVRP